jgi:hypothetical protein
LVSDIALDLDAGIGLFLLQRCVDVGGLGGIDYRADLHQLPGNVLRHRALLGEGGRGGEEVRRRAAAAKTDFAFVIPAFSAFLQVSPKMGDLTVD